MNNTVCLFPHGGKKRRFWELDERMTNGHASGKKLRYLCLHPSRDRDWFEILVSKYLSPTIFEISTQKTKFYLCVETARNY